MNDVLAVIVSLITIVSIGGSAVWAVSSIRRDTALLRLSINHLSEEVKLLRRSVDKLDERLDDHEHRITVLETQPSGPRN